MLTQCGDTRLELKTGGQVESSQSSQSTFSGCFLDSKNREGRGAKEVQSPDIFWENVVITIIYIGVQKGFEARSILFVEGLSSQEDDSRHCPKDLILMWRWWLVVFCSNQSILCHERFDEKLIIYWVIYNVMVVSLS